MGDTEICKTHGSMLIIGTCIMEARGAIYPGKDCSATLEGENDNFVPRIPQLHFVTCENFSLDATGCVWL